jgi:hypothetical protein
MVGKTLKNLVMTPNKVGSQVAMGKGVVVKGGFIHNAKGAITLIGAISDFNHCFIFMF